MITTVTKPHALVLIMRLHRVYIRMDKVSVLKHCLNDLLSNCLHKTSPKQNQGLLPRTRIPSRNPMPNCHAFDNKH